MSCRAVVSLAWTGVAIVAVASSWSLVSTCALAFDLLGLAGFAVLGLVVLACCVDGSRGLTIGLALFAGVVLAAPWYAFLTRGEWQQLAVTYGGHVVGLSLLGLALLVHRAQARTRRPPIRLPLVVLHERTLKVSGN